MFFFFLNNDPALVDASHLLEHQGNTFEEKLELFEKLYKLLSDAYPIETKKLKLYSVNRLNGAIDKEYLRKYQNKEYVEQNISILSSFVEGKKNMFGLDHSHDVFYMKSIRIENFRLISKMELEFQKGINLLIGDNGVGKTSILDAIAISLRETIGSFNVTQKKMETKDISVGEEKAIIYSVVSDGKEEYYAAQGINSKGKSLIFLDKEKRKRLSVYLSNRYLYPVISYHCVSAGKQEKPYKTLKRDRMQGYVGCLNGRADILLVTKWLNKAQDDEKDKYFSIINEFLKNMLPERIIDITYNQEEFMVKTGQKEVPLSYMSSGFQSILNLVMDISFRLTVLNPSIAHPAKMFGIVLIDEIELHLHPKWQWSVLSCLEKMFPNIQFIISTHSPMIISSCKKCNLISLSINSNGELEYSSPSTNGLYGKAIEDVLVYNMSSQRIPSKLMDYFEEFQKYYIMGEYISAENVLKKMEKKYGSDNGTVKKARFMLSLSFDD